MTALTRWTLSHKLIVVGFWLIVTVVGFASASASSPRVEPSRATEPDAEAA
ncbi:MAG TPA: hypothetical protein VF898_11365 [Chloroflexota bacterium]